MSASELFPVELVAELRAVPMAASPQVRDRVRALGEPAPRRARAARFPIRRTLLVAVAVCGLALVAAAVVHGVLSSSTPKRGELAATRTRPLRAPGAAVGSVPLAPPHRAALVPAPSPTRHQNYQAYLRVRVKNYDAVGRETASAMRIATELGGFVASVQQSSAKSSSGEANVVLRVPVANVERAMIRLSALGTVLDQHVSIVDLEQTVRQQRGRIRALRVRIAKIIVALQESLPADVRLRLEFQLNDAGRALARATGAHNATVREAALSRIALTLTTERAVAAPAHHRGRFGTAVANAAGFLAAAGAVALLLLIMVSPLLLLALLWWYGARAWRRRQERRLLAEA
jgi:hypothetical protein